MTENRKVLKVLNGFTELSLEEKQLLIRELNDYLSKPPIKQLEHARNLQTKLNSNLGPTNDRNCPCCGKS